MYLKTLWTLLQHKWYVFRAGLVLKVPLWQLIIHDLSKFSLYEFGKYARNFQGDYTGSPNDRELVSLEFQKAWVHHENRNAHHWGHWIPRAGTMAGIPVPLPERYVREMIADCTDLYRSLGHRRVDE